MKLIKTTDEQKEIINHNLLPGEILKVIAFAGTGKTSTLVEYAKARPRMKFLYVAFNKSVQLDAQNKFHSNVACRTSHSLAFRNFGAEHQHRIAPGFKPNIVKEALDLQSYEDARHTIDTLHNYLISSDTRITRHHVPAAAWPGYADRDKNRRKILDIVKFAKSLMQLMCDPGWPL